MCQDKRVFYSCGHEDTSPTLPRKIKYCTQQRSFYEQPHHDRDLTPQGDPGSGVELSEPCSRCRLHPEAIDFQTLLRQIQERLDVEGSHAAWLSSYRMPSENWLVAIERLLQRQRDEQAPRNRDFVPSPSRASSPGFDDNFWV